MINNIEIKVNSCNNKYILLYEVADKLELKIGTILTLEPIPTAENLEKYHCKIVDRNDRVIFIDYPVNTLTNKTAYLIDGSQFRVTYSTEDKNSYAFNTQVVGRKVANIPMIMLLLPPEEEIIKIQRREFVRVNTTVDVAVEFEGKYYQFVTEDVSAGGIALNLLNKPVSFQDGDHINLTMVLPYSNGDIQYVKTKALVVRIFDKNKLRLASIQFIDMDDLDKQYIVRFCFERQLMIRRKELNNV